MTIRTFRLPRIQNPNVLRLLLLASLIGAAATLALVSFLLVNNFVLSHSVIDAEGRPHFSFQPSQPPAAGGQSTASTGDLLGGVPIPDIPGAPVSEPSLAPWDGTSRVTMLLMGVDYRDWTSGSKAARSDTMILLTLDPLTKTAGVLSIPRDLWVAIPGFQHGKINTALYLGDAYKLPGGGPGLAIKTVELFLGVPINYYAQIDFASFVRFIDEIGGVEIDVPEPIKIDLLGDGYKTIKNLKPGRQVLPGEWALAYARNRYTPGGDFDRARRQQQVIMGIRDRVLDLKLLPTLIAKAPTLIQEIGSGVRTNLSLEDASRLALLAQQVPAEQIQRGVIDQKYVQFGWSPDNLSILVPMPDKIHTLRDEIFATGAGLGPLTPGETWQKMALEQAHIVVYNGSQEEDLDERVAKALKSHGADAVAGGAADQITSATSVIDYSGSPYALSYLVDLFQVSTNRITIQFEPGAAADIELILGTDAQGMELP